MRRAAATVLALAGCAAERPPAIAVTGLRLAGGGEGASAVECVLELSNLNEQPLALEEFRYGLRIDGEVVYHGRRAAQLTLGPGTTRTVTLPGVVDPDVLPARCVLEGTLGYRAPGHLAQMLFDMKVRRPKTSFRHEGELR